MQSMRERHARCEFAMRRSQVKKYCAQRCTTGLVGVSLHVSVRIFAFVTIAACLDTAIDTRAQVRCDFGYPDGLG